MSNIANLINLSMGFESEEGLDQSLDQMTEEELDAKLEAEENALDVSEQTTKAEIADQAVETVTGIQESVESFQSKVKSHSDRTAKYTAIALKRGYGLLGMESAVGLESFGENTGMALESFSNELKQTAAQLKEFQLKTLKQVSKSLTAGKTIGLESLEDGEAAVVEEPVNTDIDGDTLAENTAIAEAGQSEDQVNDIENGVNDASVIVSEFEKDVEEGNVNEDVLEAADFATESLAWGCPGLKPIKISDYYKNGHFDKEGFSYSMENEFGSLFNQMFERWTANFYRGFGYLVTRSLVHRARLSLLISKANKESGNANSGKRIRVNMKYLHKEGQVPSNLAKYIQEYAVWTRPVIETFHESAKTAFKQNALILNKINSGNGTIQELMSNWQDPRKSINNPAYPVPGGRLLFSKTDRRVNPTTKEGKFFASVAYENYPTIIFYRKFSDLGKVDIQAMSASDIARTSEELKRSIAGINKFQSIVNSIAASHKYTLPMAQNLLTITILAARRMYPTVKEADDTSKAVNDAMKVSRRMCFNVAYDAAATLLTVSSGWIKAAKASL